MKIRCYMGFFVTFGSGFQIKLTIYESSLILRFVSMSELEVYVQNFNTMELANFLEKNQRLQLQIQAITLKITSYRTMCNFFNKIK
jgi:hypothetical protein